jgi:hypothetical protein
MRPFVFAVKKVELLVCRDGVRCAQSDMRGQALFPIFDLCSQMPYDIATYFPIRATPCARMHSARSSAKGQMVWVWLETAPCSYSRSDLIRSGTSYLYILLNPDRRRVPPLIQTP